MVMEILTEPLPPLRESREDKPGGRDGLFLWSLVIVVLIGLNAFAWAFCLYVFGHPEVPFNYSLLKRVERVDPLEGFTPVSAPRGTFRTAEQLYADYFDYPEDERAGLNDRLRRNYLLNYLEVEDVTYVLGNFTVEAVRPLDEGDAIRPGLAIHARSEDYPPAVIDYLLPTGEEDAPDAQQALYQRGDRLTIGRSDTCAALLYVAPLVDGELRLTAVPLVMHDEETPGGTILSVAPPDFADLDAAWPLAPEWPEPGPLVARPLDVEAVPPPEVDGAPSALKAVPVEPAAVARPAGGSGQP